MPTPASGSLALSSVSSSGAVFRYATGTDFDHGTLTVRDLSRGLTVASVPAAATVTVTGLQQDTSYAAWVLPEGSADEIGPACPPVVFRTPVDLQRSGKPILLQTKTERTDWRTYVMGEGSTRVNVATGANGRGYEFRTRIEGNAQNGRMTLRGIRAQVRQQTRGDKAETA